MERETQNKSWLLGQISAKGCSKTWLYGCKSKEI